MNFLYRFQKVFSVAIIASFLIAVTAFAQEMPRQKYQLSKNELNKTAKTVSLENLLPMKANMPTTQAAEFRTFDSLSNLFSCFYLMTNKTYVMDRTTGNLLHIKRGYYNPNSTPGYDNYDGQNRSYNLLLRKSSDLGKTWDDEIVIYDKDAVGYFSARYPTCYGFEMDGKQMVATAFPVIDYQPQGTSSWQGFVSEMWNPDIQSADEIPMNAHINLEYNGKTLNWSTDSKVLAGVYKDDPSKYFYVAASELSPVDENDFENASHIGIRKTDDIESDFTETIPDAWNSNKFKVVNQANTRYNQLIDLKMDANQVMYLAVYGGFLNTEINEIGVSISTDYGTTWSDFDIIPKSVRDNYVSSMGYPGGSLAIGYTTKGFAVFDNGDFSIVCHGALLDANDNVIDYGIYEFYKENGAWGIREVAKPTGAYITYADVTDQTTGDRLNPSDIELQLARTIDGSALVAKWVDLIGYDQQAGTFLTTDIYLASRSKNSNSWGDTLNVTKSDEIDRCTLLPDYVPNDLTGIPILKMYAATMADKTERDSQFYSIGDQYVQVGNFDTVVGVEDNLKNNDVIKMEVMPNPVSDFAKVSVYTETKDANAVISLYDLLGNKVLEIYNGNLNYGMNFFDINLSKINSGAYYCTIKTKTTTISKMMNVIK